MSADRNRRFNVRAALAGALIGVLAGPPVASAMLDRSIQDMWIPDLVGVVYFGLACLIPPILVVACALVAGTWPHSLGALLGGAVGLQVGSRVVLPWMSLEGPMLAFCAVGAAYGAVVWWLARRITVGRIGDPLRLDGAAVDRGTSILGLAIVVVWVSGAFAVPYVGGTAVSCVITPVDPQMCGLIRQVLTAVDPDLNRLDSVDDSRPSRQPF